MSYRNDGDALFARLEAVLRENDALRRENTALRQPAIEKPEGDSPERTIQRSDINRESGIDSTLFGLIVVLTLSGIPVVVAWLMR